MDARGVSSPIGMVLIIGMTVAAVTTLVVGGGAVIDETRADAERSQMENAMSQFSSKASLVGLGESGAQRFNLGRTSEGDVTVREDAGNVSLYIDYTGGGRDYISNVSMGSIVYQNGQTAIAYQGGGVWKRSNGHSTMVSPPEYHYRFETLTFPIINVTGSGAVSGQVGGIIRSDVNSEQLFPNADENANFTNPLENGTVYVQIESDYCEGWENFFRERSQGDLEQACDVGDEDTVVMDLTVPLDPAFGYAVTSQNIEVDGANMESTREGVVASSATDNIEDRIAECEEDGCDGGLSGTLESGVYYTEDGGDFADIDTFNTSDGEVEVIVNDDDGGISGSGEISITGDNNVTVYVKTEDDVSLGGGDEINYGGDPSKLIMYVHSDVSAIKMSGSAKYTGGIYAPNTRLEGDQGGGNGNGNGNGNGGGGCGGGSVEVTGSVIVENFCFRNGEFTYQPEMADLEVEVEPDTVKYLHVSENAVEIDLS